MLLLRLVISPTVKAGFSQWLILAGGLGSHSGINTILINRAPVLTLWTAVVAERFYKNFRPKIPAGVGGWDAKGELELSLSVVYIH